MEKNIEKILVVSGSGSVTELAVLENKKLVEYHRDFEDDKFKVGDFYVGKIKKLIPGLNSAFVDVGHEKDGFLHYSDMGENVKSVLKFTNSSINKKKYIDISKVTLEPKIHKVGKIADILSNKKNILVQIQKEPISAKGPRLSCDFSIPGRFLVLVPFGNTIAVSKKIASYEERKRLNKILESVRPKNFGIIARTASIDKDASEIHKELQSLIAVWNNVQKTICESNVPSRLVVDVKKSYNLIQELLHDDYSKIIVNDKNIHRFIVEHLKSISPGKESIVNIFSQRYSVFEYFSITRQLKILFSKKISLKSGAYLIVEETEALHVIDVNSGKRGDEQISQEENALSTNLEAVEEIARILKVREIGGIIVIDCIDMKTMQSKKKVYDALKQAMKNDKAKHTILQPSRFNLIQITRQRVRSATNLKIQESCPSCRGTGEIGTPYQIEEEIIEMLKIITKQVMGKIYITVHPIFYSYLTSGFMSIRFKWSMKLRRKIKIIPSKDFNFLEYKFFNHNMDEIVV